MSILRRLRELGRRNSANWYRNFGKRYQFAEFLLPSSLKRLRILISPTCVGLRYGLVKLKLRGFSWNHFRLLLHLSEWPHTLEFRARICLSAFSNARTGTSNTRTTFRDPSPHRI